MKEKINRRGVLKVASAVVVSNAVSNSTAKPNASSANLAATEISSSWTNTPNQIWLGEEFWANPMEDWRIQNGMAQCTNSGANRNVHSLIHQLVDPKSAFQTSVVVYPIEKSQKDGGAALRLGVRSEINEYRSNCFAHKSGLNVGVVNDHLLVGKRKKKLAEQVNQKPFKISVTGTPQADKVQLNIEVALLDSGDAIGELAVIVDANDVIGNIALVSNFSVKSKSQFLSSHDNEYGRFGFSDWTIQGGAFGNEPNQKFGPILWSMYTLDRSGSDEEFTLKLNAFIGPVAIEDVQRFDFEFASPNGWKKLGGATIDPQCWVASFKFENWDAEVSQKYRLVFKQGKTDNSESVSYWHGTIQANPNAGKLRMAAMTCQKDYAFPYEPLVDSVAAMDPDILFFSGDQIYEDHGGYGLIRAPADRAI
ncbi:MAG: twin-arginine translocation pathway signal, partial [Planctomycetota bacterium]